MKKLIAAIALVLFTAASAWAVTGFFKYETSCGSMLKQCHYDVLGDDYVINIRCTRICPITIQVNR